MRKAARRHHLVIAGAVLLIAITLFFYAGLAYDWLRPSARARRPAGRADVSAALQKARAGLRSSFLDPLAHMRLAEALYRAARPIDAFYVLYGARGLFGDEAFNRAHALTALYGDRVAREAAAFDLSPAGTARLKDHLRGAPEDAAAADYLARLAASQGRIQEALSLLEGGLAASPDDPGLLSYRAELAARAGDERAAIPLWTRIISKHPGTFPARSAWEQLGRLAQRPAASAEDDPARLAMDALADMCRRRPDDPRAFSTLAMAVWGRGDLAGVRAMVAEALSQNDPPAGAAMVEGALALNDRDPDKAIRRFTAAWEKDPDDLYSAAKLAQLHFKQRADRELALPFYLALYRANPAYADGAPAEERIREILDFRREALLRYAAPDAIGRSLLSEDASLRAEACVQAARLKDPRWVDILVELLDDDTEIVRHNADYALFQIARSAPDSIRGRRSDWLDSERPLVRARALNLFADLDPKNTFPALLKALRDPDPTVRFLARTMVLEHYYRDAPEAAGVRSEYLARESDPLVLSLYARLYPGSQTPTPPRRSAKKG